MGSTASQCVGTGLTQEHLNEKQNTQRYVKRNQATSELVSLSFLSKSEYVLPKGGAIHFRDMFDLDQFHNVLNPSDHK